MSDLGSKHALAVAEPLPDTPMPFIWWLWLKQDHALLAVAAIEPRAWATFG